MHTDTIFSALVVVVVVYSMYAEEAACFSGAKTALAKALKGTVWKVKLPLMVRKQTANNVSVSPRFLSFHLVSFLNHLTRQGKITRA